MRPRLRAGHRPRHEDRAGAVQLVRLRRHQRDARVPSLPLILVDGEARDTLAATDRGLAFGDGVFRTLAIRAGRPLNSAWHFRRLAEDCACLGLAMPGEPLLRAELARVAPGDHAAKIIVTRGAGGRGYAAAAAIRPSRIVSAFTLPAYPPQNAQDGVRVRRCALVLSEQPRLAGAKTLNRLENVLARGEWDDPAIAEGLLADAQGRVIEGIMSNVFIVRQGRVATPRLDRCGVIGAQRERVRELLAAMGIPCEEASCSWSAVLEADEVFLTNSLIGAWPVRAFEGREWLPGPVTRAVQQAMAADDARP